MDPSENLKEYGHDKLLRLEKYLDAVIDAEVVMTVEKFRHRAEILISSDGLKIKAEEETEDMYSAIDMVVDKLEKQIKRHREKLKTHKGGNAKRTLRQAGAGAPAEDDFEADDFEEGFRVDRSLTVTPDSMSPEEAGAQLAAGSSPQIIFINRENERLSILRQAQGGQLELITINH
jgi:putative sigma-54 modulation protein